MKVNERRVIWRKKSFECLGIGEFFSLVERDENNDKTQAKLFQKMVVSDNGNNAIYGAEETYIEPERIVWANDGGMQVY